MEHGDDLRDVEYLVLHEVSYGVVDGLLALYFDGGQHFDGFDALPHLAHIDYFLGFLLD